jgi:hypothetical protein
MSAMRDQINDMMKQARDLAMATMLQPKSEREYLLACGKVQQLVKGARELKARFIEEQQPDTEVDLPDDPTDSEDPAPRRVQPQQDRLARARAGHRPRQM